MPNRDKHVAIGVLAGSSIAAYRACEQDELTALLETVGGAIAGYCGSRLPDIIEPASWPGHRQFAHSAIFGSGILSGLYTLLEEWEEYFRSQAQYYCDKKSKGDICWLQKLLYAIFEILYRILAGCMSGLGAGYISHLYADGCMPKGLPLVQ